MIYFLFTVYDHHVLGYHVLDERSSACPREIRGICIGIVQFISVLVALTFFRHQSLIPS